MGAAHGVAVWQARVGANGQGAVGSFGPGQVEHRLQGVQAAGVEAAAEIDGADEGDERRILAGALAEISVEVDGGGGHGVQAFLGRKALTMAGLVSMRGPSMRSMQ